MSQHALLALTHEDLILLSNKGTLKRALRELEQGAVSLLSIAHEAEASRIVAQWSDEVTCTIDLDEPLDRASCTCPSPRCCRHILRTVLHYQQQRQGEPLSDQEAIWSPLTGDMTRMLATAPKEVIAAAKRLLHGGEVLRVWAGVKPVAMFYRSGHAVRFMAREELRFTRCSCGESPPCVHSVAGVMARQWPARGAYIETFSEDEAQQQRERAQLEQVMQLLERWFCMGLNAAPREALQRLKRQARALEAADLERPAQLMEAFAAHAMRYLERDPSLHLHAQVEHVGELVLRCEALMAPEAEVARSLLRGLGASGSVKIGATTLIGLGAQVQLDERAQRLSALYFDTLRRRPVALSVVTHKPAADEPQEAQWPAEHALLATLQTRLGLPFYELAQRQLVVAQAKLIDGAQLEVQDRDAAAYHQELSWHELGEPIYHEDVESLTQQLDAQPPSALRLGRALEDLYVLRVARVSQVSFNDRLQRVEARLEDARGGEVWLSAPYERYNRQGAEQLLALLEELPEQLCYVSGMVWRVGELLKIEPVGVVYEVEGQRALFIPQLGTDQRATSSAQLRKSRLGPLREVLDPLAQLREELARFLWRALMMGTDTLEAPLIQEGAQVWALAQVLGLTQALWPLGRFIEDAQRQDASAQALAQHLLKLSAIFCLLRELR